MTTIYLIRHGEAEGNVFRRFHGQYNSLLTPRGLLQVKCVEKRFENIQIDGCFSSDLTRTSLTARSIYVPKGLPLVRDPRFREVNLGIWEDIPFGYLYEFHADGINTFNNNPTAWHLKGAEDFDTYTQRFIEGMVDAADSFPGGTVAIFGHGAVIRGVLMRLFFRGNSEEIPFCDNTGVCCLTYDRGEFGYRFLNDNSHLPTELSTFAFQSWWRSTGRNRDVDLYFEQYDGRYIGMDTPETDPNGRCLIAFLRNQPVGLVSLGAQQGNVGKVLGMTLLDGMDDRFYGDQLLGSAVSHFRSLGCKSLSLNLGCYPDNIVERYGFDADLYRSIDPNAFDWGN